MINFKREYIGLEQDRLLYPVSFKDKAKCNVYGRKKFITEAGEVQLSAHVFLISKDFWTFNAGQLDFTNYPNGIWNDYISIDIIEKDEYTAPSINFGSMGDITPENLQGLSDYISKHLSDLEKRIVEDYLFIDEGISENIELPNLPENHFWARKNGVIVGVNLDYLKADYEHFKNELWKNYESFNEKLQAALKKYYDDLELQMNNFFKDLIEKIREEAEKQLGLIAGAGGGLLHKIDQANHGFIFDPIVYENGVWKKATTTSGVDGIGVVISANTFFFLEAGEIEIPKGATDKDGQPLLDDEYYYMNEDGGTGFQKEEPVWFYQPLFHTRTYKGKLLANVHIDTIEDLRGQVVDTESGRTHGIALWGDIVPKFDTIEKLQKAFWLKEGEVVEVLGYYAQGDGANHKRIIKAEDDGSGVQLSNNLWANCSTEVDNRGYIDIRWFGAKSDFNFETKVGTDISSVLKKCIDYSNTRATTPIAIIGNFYIGNPIVTNGQLHMFGYSTPSRLLISNATGYNLKIKPVSSIWVKEGITAITLDGTGESGTTGVRDTHLFLEKINLFSEKCKSTFIRCTTFGAPSRPGYCKTVEATGFDKVFLFDFYEGASINGTNYYNFQIDDDCYFYGNNYSISAVGKDGTSPSLGGVSIANSVLEQGAKIDLKNLFGYSEIRNCLLEGQDNIFDISSQSYLSKLSIIGNYFEVNGGICNISRSSLEMKNNYILSSDFKFNFHACHLMDIDLSENNISTIKNCGYDKKIFNSIKKISLNKLISAYGNALTGMFDINFLKESELKNGVLLEKSSYDNIINSLKMYNILETYSNIYAIGYSPLNLKANEYIVLTFYKTKGAIDLGMIKDGSSGTDFSIGREFSSEGIFTIVYKITSDVNNFIIYGKKYDTDTMISSMIVRKFTEEELKAKKLEDIIYIYQTPIQDPVTVNSLNTLYHMEKMKEENVYDDYISYMDEKTLYDKQQRKLSEQRQLAYEEALKENPELTHEEFMSLQPMTLNLVEEPQPSENLKKFMEKYL